MSTLKISSASSTLCPACALRVEHRSNYAIATVTTQLPDGLRTKLVANGAIVIHACVTANTPAPQSA